MSEMPEGSCVPYWRDETYESMGVFVEDWEFDAIGSGSVSSGVSITGFRRVGGSALFDDADYSGRYFDEYH